MKASEFCYWLQGVFEVAKLEELDKEQTQIIKNHLGLVFVCELDKIEEVETGLDASSLNDIHNATNNSPDNETRYRC